MCVYQPGSLSRSIFILGWLSGFVYRFVSTGTIEEKIFQRQAAKQSLSASMIDNVVQGDDQLVFSAQDLRKLFLYKGHHTICETHETFKCKRCKNGKQHIKSQAMLYGDASTYVVPSTLSLATGLVLIPLLGGTIGRIQISRTITTICCGQRVGEMISRSSSNT